MKKLIEIGDMVIHAETNVIGTVIRQYYPTGCSQQTMVRTLDGQKYHAPTNQWRHYDAFGYIKPCCEDAAMNASAPIMVEHEYRKIKVGDGTYITVDLDDIKRNLSRELFKDLESYRGLHYGA